MKRLLLAYFFIISSSISVLGQNNRFGVKSGIAISSMSQQEMEIGNTQIEWDGKTAYQTGFFYNRRLDNSLLSFQVEVDYKKLGTTFSIKDIDPDATSSSKAEYEFEHIGISVLPRIDLFPDKKLNPNFMFGGIIDVRKNSKLTLRAKTGNNDSITRNGFIGGDINHRTENLLFGYVMAGGVEIATKPVIITVESRYTSLFTSVFDSSVEDLPLNAETYLLKVMEDSRHNYFSFLLGFNFYF